jgi:predicted anti-sigma-YlaC factor YlaD
MPELAVVRALLERALRLDEDWEGGAIHEGMIALEGLPVLAGGSAARARKHFERAVELSEGESALAYVTFAMSVPLRARNRAEFDMLLKKALAVDVARRPDLRLANLVAQKRARFLLGMGERLFK